MTAHSEATLSLNKPTRRPRDPRLDFFRGIGMLIILLAHVPNDPWALWIPARFGFSDATEMFVFQSGMASALAFGTLFDRQGLLALTGRILHRIWQIYWAHICVFVTVVALMSFAGTRPDGANYLGTLNLIPFVENPAALLASLLTLTYVPNYFDILPMYMVILALLPMMLMAERVHAALPIGLMIGIWLATQFGYPHFPAEPWSNREWFFDPFGWQLLFFSGFFLMRKTIPAPGFNPWLMVLALVLVFATIPFAWYRTLDWYPELREIANALGPLTNKSHFGILRFVHFLALCYIAVNVVGKNGKYLRGPLVRVISVIGQQSLAVFVTSMVLAQIIGIALDYTSRSPLPVALANLAGFGVVIITAYAVRWFKLAPWATVTKRK